MQASLYKFKTVLELHIGSDPAFTKKYGQKVLNVGGVYSECRGCSERRFVHVPAEHAELIDSILRDFGGINAIVIVRGVYETILKKGYQIKANEMENFTQSLMSRIRGRLNDGERQHDVTVGDALYFFDGDNLMASRVDEVTDSHVIIDRASSNRYLAVPAQNLGREFFRTADEAKAARRRELEGFIAKHEEESAKLKAKIAAL